jgi:hypothetical protein
VVNTLLGKPSLKSKYFKLKLEVTSRILHDEHQTPWIQGQLATRYD